MNLHAIRAIYLFELARIDAHAVPTNWRTAGADSPCSPVLQLVEDRLQRGDGAADVLDASDDLRPVAPEIGRARWVRGWIR